MPYIKNERRIPVLTYDGPRNAGELNYLISTYSDNYITQKGLCYQTLNDIAGVLSCLDKEVYRRITSVLEDKKIFENGDVFSEEFIK